MTQPTIQPVSAQRTSALVKISHALSSLLFRVEVDRAVTFALLTRAWQLLAAPVTLVLIASYFTPAMQGFYYTFASLLALQSFVELGFYLVIINVASHEWAQLSLDNAGRIVGHPDAVSRLASLGRLSFRWYSVASIIFMGGVGIAGTIFFLQAPHPGVQWQAPWWTLVVLNGFLLCTVPFTAILEGCNQVATLNEFRLRQAILSNLALWVTVALGGALWAAVIFSAVGLLSALYLIFVQYRHFFLSFLQPPSSACLHWKTEILPMQWRLALSGLVNYFACSLFNPVMFHYHGAAVAGQMGMTWQLVNVLQLSAMAWVQTRVPHFGALIAKKEYDVLDRTWLRTSLISLVILSCGASIAWLLVYCLYALDLPLAYRLLAPLPAGLFLLAAILLHISQCQSAYLRAHKREPIMVVSVTSGLMIGALVWWWGIRFGPTGAATGYLLVVAGYLIPYETLIWRRCRAEWHQPGGMKA